MLQYADNTIFVGEAIATDVFTIKAMLRAFELASGLRVNFYKSCCGALGVVRREVERFAAMLNCRLLSFPFVYLGISIGAIPRKIEMWEPIIQKFSKKLALWEQKFISFAGRACLIQSSGTDVWLWRKGSICGNFTTNTAYKWISSINRPQEKLDIYSRLWHSKIPIKALFFIWKLLKNRLAQDEMYCPF
ncbi:hypothetical protein HKD37_06G016039 [Glycine soja]